jgi:hypothetical protein
MFPIMDEAYEITTTSPVSFVPFFRGTPGVGKTQKVGQWCAARKLKLRTLYLPAAAPTDVVCYMPDETTKQLRAFFNERLPDERLVPDEKGVIFFDEITKAHPEVVKPVIKLINERELDGLRIPRGYMFAAAGNTLESRSGDLRLMAAFSQRMSHYEFSVDAEEVADYFTEKGYPVEVVAYLLGVPDSVERFQPDLPTWPSPRTWERVSLKMMLAEKQKRQLSVKSLAAEIGDAEAKQFWGALENMKKLPSMADIIAHPKKEEIPEKISDQFAVIAMTAYRADKDVFGALAQYVQRMPLNRQLLFLRLVRRRHDRAFLQVKEYASWIVQPDITKALSGQV